MAEIIKLVPVYKCEALKWHDERKNISLCQNTTVNSNQICDECKTKGRGKTFNDLSDWDLEMARLHHRIKYLKGEIGPTYFCGKGGCIVDVYD